VGYWQQGAALTENIVKYATVFGGELMSLQSARAPALASITPNFLFTP